MKLLEWFTPSGVWSNNQFICKALWKDICLDIGKCFKNTETKKELSLSELQVTGNEQLGELKLQITLPVQHPNDKKIHDEITDIEEAQYGYITELIKRNFSYAVAIKDPEYELGKMENDDKLYIRYTIYLDLKEERILPLGRKIKKSILRSKEIVLSNETKKPC